MVYTYYSWFNFEEKKWIRDFWWWFINLCWVINFVKPYIFFPPSFVTKLDLCFIVSWVADISFKGLGFGPTFDLKNIWQNVVYLLHLMSEWANIESPSPTANCQNWFISDQSDLSFHGWDLLEFPLWGHTYKNNISWRWELLLMVVDMVLPKTCHEIVYFVCCHMFIRWSRNKYSDLFRYMKTIIIFFCVKEYMNVVYLVIEP